VKSEATSEEPRVPEREKNSIRESEFRRFGKAEKSRCVAEGKQGLEELGERGSWVKGQFSDKTIAIVCVNRPL